MDAVPARRSRRSVNTVKQARTGIAMDGTIVEQCTHHIVDAVSLQVVVNQTDILKTRAFTCTQSRALTQPLLCTLKAARTGATRTQPLQRALKDHSGSRIRLSVTQVRNRNGSLHGCNQMMFAQVRNPELLVKFVFPRSHRIRTLIWLNWRLPRQSWRLPRPK